MWKTLLHGPGPLLDYIDSHWKGCSPGLMRAMFTAIRHQGHVPQRRKHGFCNGNESQQTKDIRVSTHYIHLQRTEEFFFRAKGDISTDCIKKINKNQNCCNAASCSLFVSFDSIVSPFTDKPAGSRKAKLFPFGWFLHVIPFSGCVFVKDTHSWERYRWLQIYCLPVWPSAAWISYGSHNAGPDTELLNHALASTQFPSVMSSDVFHPTHCHTNSLKTRFKHLTDWWPSLHCLNLPLLPNSSSVFSSMSLSQALAVHTHTQIIHVTETISILRCFI